ncbi:uncharacterized protein TNCV_1537671 [Trichonephila clavipes]|nr:uncharacterized protein TNCV_1537671 [Trichonephila clavipes]
MKTSSALVPVMAVWWLNRSHVIACNQSICDLGTLDLHLELQSGEQVLMTAGALPCLLIANLFVGLVIQSVMLPIRNNIQGGVFQQDKLRHHTAVVTQHAL